MTTTKDLQPCGAEWKGAPSNKAHYHESNQRQSYSYINIQQLPVRPSGWEHPCTRSRQLVANGCRTTHHETRAVHSTVSRAFDKSKNFKDRDRVSSQQSTGPATQSSASGRCVPAQRYDENLKHMPLQSTPALPAAGQKAIAQISHVQIRQNELLIVFGPSAIIASFSVCSRLLYFGLQRPGRDVILP